MQVVSADNATEKYKNGKAIYICLSLKDKEDKNYLSEYFSLF